MNALTQARMSRQLIVNDLTNERQQLEMADGPAYEQSQNRINNLYKTVSEMDSKISELTEAELFTADHVAAISRAVKISQIKTIDNLLTDCFLSSSNKVGLTGERYTAIKNELSRALKELAA